MKSIVFVLLTALYLTPSIGFSEDLSDDDRKRFIDSDKQKIVRIITKFNRAAYKTCKTKLTVSLDHSAAESLALIDQQVKYERLHKNIRRFVENFETACKDGDFQQELKTKKNINLTLNLDRNVWKIRSRGRKVLVDVPNSPADKDLVSMLKKKVK